MEVAFTKTFSKQIDNIRDNLLKSKLAQVVRDVMKAKALQDIANLKKLKGHLTAYRIRIGDYRVGLFIEEGVVTFAYLAHRKDIYSRFP
jgi:mRNA interferase RelE/StbE